MLRTAPEEFNLAANVHVHDVTAAEFIRTYQSQSFPGGRLVRLHDAEKARTAERVVLRRVPVRKGALGGSVISQANFEDFYGYRGKDARVHYLSPWEFLMYWEAVSLTKPSSAGAAETGTDQMETTVWSGVPSCGAAVAGIDFYVNEALNDHIDYVVFPMSAQLEDSFRHTWALRRRSRPHVPQPDGTPMPDREATVEGRAKLYSVYMRPWVLDPNDVSASVPHILDLDLLPSPPEPPARRTFRVKTTDPATRRRNMSEAWSSYVRGHIVSHHAKKIITQFMAANCGKSKRVDGNEERCGRDPDMEEKKSRNELDVARIHALLAEGLRQEDSLEASLAADASLEHKMSAQVRSAMRLGGTLWGLEGAQWSANVIDKGGHVSGNSAECGGDAAIQERQASASSSAKKEGAASKLAYLKLKKTSVEQWFQLSHWEHLLLITLHAQVIPDSRA